MRIVICGDTHIGAVFGLGKQTKAGGNTRVDDYERTLNHIVDYAIKNKVDAFVQTGDAFDSRTPAPEHMAVFNKAIKKLSLANITSVIIMGNHDYRRSGETFTSAISSLAAKDYPNVRIVLTPEVLSLHGRNKVQTDIVLLPYRDRRMYEGTNTAEDSALYEKEILDLISGCDKQTPTIAIGHNFYYTGSYNDYGGTEVLAKIDTFKDCDLVAMGHYHQFKILRKNNPISIYTGSMEKLNFGDEKIDKFFIDYDSDTKKTTILKCPSRQLIDISINLADSNHTSLFSDLEAEIGKLDLEDKIARIKISIRDSLLGFIKKAKVEKLLYSAGAFYVSKVIVEPIFTRMVRDDEILKHKDDFSMFKAFLEGQRGMDEEDVKSILTEAKKIMT